MAGRAARIVCTWNRQRINCVGLDPRDLLSPIK